jgi:predicted ribosomally synthesized peptide with SipW-like signal peptide
MKRLLLSVLFLGITSLVAIGATTAYFSDTEISSANTFTAGTLDLKLDHGDIAVTKFTLAGLRPGNQPRGTYNLMNDGSITGDLSISKIKVLGSENLCTEPELEAGDDCLSVLTGDLQKVLNLRIFVDNDGSGWISTGDYTAFNGKVVDLPSSLPLNKSLAGGQNVNVVFLFDWWGTSIDNQAQDDSFEMGIEFSLEQPH